MHTNAIIECSYAQGYQILDDAFCVMGGREVSWKSVLGTLTLFVTFNLLK